jgi:branched-chain amino acid aminotransferase
MITDLDVVTPPLDGTILPGLTRASCIELAQAHGSKTFLPGLADTLKLHVQERRMTMADLQRWQNDGALRECFCVGTAVIIAPVGRVGFTGHPDVVLPEHSVANKNRLGPVGAALRERIDDIQIGRVAYEKWSVLC